MINAWWVECPCLNPNRFWSRLLYLSRNLINLLYISLSNSLDLTLDPKLTYRTQIHNISVQAHTPLQMIKAVTATGWGKQKEKRMASYKAVMRLALESSSSICTQDTKIQHLHDETLILPIHEYSSTRHNKNINTTFITPLTQTYNIHQHSNFQD